MHQQSTALRNPERLLRRFRCKPWLILFAFLLRFQVMVENMMALEGTPTTVAVIGFTHLFGIEERLAALGWVPTAMP